MSRYFFHIRDDDGIIPDEEGTECDSAAEAKREAMLSIRDLVANGAKAGRFDMCRFIDMADADGNVVETIPFGAAFSELRAC